MSPLSADSSAVWAVAEVLVAQPVVLVSLPTVNVQRQDVALTLKVLESMHPTLLPWKLTRLLKKSLDLTERLRSDHTSKRSVKSTVVILDKMPFVIGGLQKGPNKAIAKQLSQYWVGSGARLFLRSF